MATITLPSLLGPRQQLGDGCHPPAAGNRPRSNPDRRILENALLRQIESLAKYQDEGGMWHTLIDDPTSYLEPAPPAASASAS